MKTPDRLLRLPAVIEMVGFRRDAIYTHMRQGKFPRQRKIGRSSAWLESEIIEWIRSRPIAQNTKTRDAEAASQNVRVWNAEAAASGIRDAAARTVETAKMAESHAEPPRTSREDLDAAVRRLRARRASR